MSDREDTQKNEKQLETDRMGMSDREREIVIHTMAVALSNYLAKLLGLFFSGFFFGSLFLLSAVGCK